MEDLVTSSGLTVLALFVAFGCGIIATYRVGRYDTAVARVILGFTSCSFLALAFYVVAVNPYPAPWPLRRLCTGVALLLLVLGAAAASLGSHQTRRRLSFLQVYSLLPPEIRALKPEQMRELLPARFHRHTLHDAQALVMAELSEMSPETLRTLSPDRLRATLKRAIPHSILDQG